MCIRNAYWGGHGWCVIRSSREFGGHVTTTKILKTDDDHLPPHQLTKSGCGGVVLNWEFLMLMSFHDFFFCQTAIFWDKNMQFDRKFFWEKKNQFTKSGSGGTYRFFVIVCKIWKQIKTYSISLACRLYILAYISSHYYKIISKGLFNLVLSNPLELQETASYEKLQNWYFTSFLILKGLLHFDWMLFGELLRVSKR